MPAAAHSAAGHTDNAVPPPVKNLPAPRFGLKVANGKVTLTGTVPDEATKAALLQRATEVYGAGNFTDEIKVAGPSETAAATPVWLNHALGLMTLGKGYSTLNGSLDLTGKSLTANGLVPDEAMRERLLGELKTTMGPEVSVADRLTLGAAGTETAANTDKPLSEEEAQVQKTLDDELTGKIVEFDSGKADITPQGQAVLDELAPILLAAPPDTHLEIGGHTDNQGKPAQNLELSQRRAAAVRTYLIDKKGLKAENLTAQGYGSTKPIADNNGEPGRQRNRRIVFKVLAH